MYYMLSVNPKVNAHMLEDQGLEYMLKIFEALEITNFVEQRLETLAEARAKANQPFS